MATLNEHGHFIFGTTPVIDEFGRRAIANTLLEDGTIIFYVSGGGGGGYNAVPLIFNRKMRFV